MIVLVLSCWLNGIDSLFGNVGLVMPYEQKLCIVFVRKVIWLLLLLLLMLLLLLLLLLLRELCKWKNQKENGVELHCIGSGRNSCRNICLQMWLCACATR